LIAAALKLLPLFFMVLPGAMAAALFTDLERSDTVFPRLIAEFAPPGLAGLMLAGLMAAIMSSVDSTLNSASTLFIMDFVKPKKPAMTHQQMATWGRYCTLILMVLAALWAPAIDHFPGLFAYLQQAFAYVTPPLVAAFAMGFCSKKIGAGAAFRGVIAGHIISAVLFAGSKLGWHDIHFTLIAGLLFFVTLVLITLFQCSPSASSPSEQQTATTAQKNADPVAPAIKTGALVLVLLTLALVISFW